MPLGTYNAYDIFPIEGCVSCRATVPCAVHLRWSFSFLCVRRCRLAPLQSSPTGRFYDDSLVVRICGTAHPRRLGKKPRFIMSSFTVANLIIGTVGRYTYTKRGPNENQPLYDWIHIRATLSVNGNLCEPCSVHVAAKAVSTPDLQIAGPPSVLKQPCRCAVWEGQPACSKDI